MFICICNRLREAELRSLAEEGLGFDEIQAVTHCGTTCGSCREFAEDLIAQVHRARPVVAVLPVMVTA
jgi:bacterioferritin-associated ferredoxin